ncbi:MAG: hypothetical protein OXC40_00550, partial [Proteobacteria bacterium]|nr:hypothetical protein [Pseudomonadota bacterium]
MIKMFFLIYAVSTLTLLIIGGSCSGNDNSSLRKTVAAVESPKTMSPKDPPNIPSQTLQLPKGLEGLDPLPSTLEEIRDRVTAKLCNKEGTEGDFLAGADIGQTLDALTCRLEEQKAWFTDTLIYPKRDTVEDSCVNLVTKLSNFFDSQEKVDEFQKNACLRATHIILSKDDYSSTNPPEDYEIENELRNVFAGNRGDVCGSQGESEKETTALVDESITQSSELANIQRALTCDLYKINKNCVYKMKDDSDGSDGNVIPADLRNPNLWRRFLGEDMRIHSRAQSEHVKASYVYKVIITPRLDINSFSKTKKKKLNIISDANINFVTDAGNILSPIRAFFWLLLRDEDGSAKTVDLSSNIGTDPITHVYLPDTDTDNTILSFSDSEGSKSIKIAPSDPTVESSITTLIEFSLENMGII